ncbi:NF-kappa-B inhibitor-like protein [Citrus sinensis]|uniref:NF-kappa-B inhibitor-like protein n=1 Tax=Citrus sinensis TaxID=2711 RepID=A0ACB8ITD4_CITSI|nr:NF-kappa-B inhibitor-like protein [Citrus sinensis]
MEALSRISFLTNYTHSHFPIFSPLPHTQTPLSKKTSPTFSSSLLRTSSRPVCEVAEEDVLQMFFKDRELNGDFISKTSDMFWLTGALKFVDFDADAGKFADNSEQAHQVIESDNDDGFLKLLKTHEWLLGDNSAPINKKPSAKLKRELMLLSVGIGTAWSGYCLITLSVQAAFSYVVGVLFRIGIRSEDLKYFLERSFKGSSLALSSPRLVIPATIYGLWVLSHRYFANAFFDFQIVAAMFGMLVYKAAAIVQVYRDNEDLQLVFPENEETSSD